MFESLEKQLETKARAEHDEQLGRDGQGKLLKAIDSLGHGWKQLRLERGSWRHVGRGIERSYRRARRAFRRIDRDHTDELLHEWRKRSKDLMYHVRLLEQIKPGKMGKLEKHLDDLSEWLGYDHDLIVLTAYLRQRGHLTPAERETLLSEVNKHRKEHLTAARHIADIVFKPKPGEFSRQLERWWDRWRE
jgi:CHAD domain-containing protein